MKASGGQIFVFAIAENILPGHGHIQASDVTKASFNWFQVPADDLRLWDRFTQPPKGHTAESSAKDDRYFESITTLEWQPDEAYRMAAHDVDRPALETWNQRAVTWNQRAVSGELYHDYVVTCVKTVSGAKIPPESRGPATHLDIDLASNLRALLTKISITPSDPFRVSRGPEDIVMAFSVQELS
jgi:hypothetical protein